MELVNAVRVNRRWVTNPASISSWRRRERAFTSEVGSPAEEQRIGTAYLATRKDPSRSTTAVPTTGDRPGVDYDVGDIVDVAGEPLRCVDIQRNLNRDNGEWLPHTPVFGSLRDEWRRDADRALDRLIAAQGGGAVDATLIQPPGSLQLGELGRGPKFTWSWSNPEDLADDDLWAVEPVREVCRAAAIVSTADFSEADGTTTFELWRNGSLWNGLFNIVHGTTPADIERAMWGYSFLFPGDRISIRVVGGSGGHRQGQYSLYTVSAT